MAIIDLLFPGVVNSRFFSEEVHDGATTRMNNGVGGGGGIVGARPQAGARGLFVNRRTATQALQRLNRYHNLTGSADDVSVAAVGDGVDSMRAVVVMKL